MNAAYDKIQNLHTYKNRSKEILNILDCSTITKNPPIRHYSKSQALSAYVELLTDFKDPIGIFESIMHYRFLSVKSFKLLILCLLEKLKCELLKIMALN